MQASLAQWPRHDPASAAAHGWGTIPAGKAGDPAVGEMRDYWLSKLMFDLQQPSAAAAFRADRDAVLARYALRPEVRRALLEDDVAALAPLVNPYLLRFYFFAVGKSEAWFLERVRALRPAPREAPHG